jgi:hypothetical protein
MLSHLLTLRSAPLACGKVSVGKEIVLHPCGKVS